MLSYVNRGMLVIYRRRASDPAQYLDLTPYEYEEYVCDRLRNMGWSRIKVTDKSGDFGADVVGVSPSHKRISVQVKQYAGTVGIDGVKEALAGKAYYRCSGSMVVSSGSGFTRSAIKLAESSGTWLWSGFGITKTLTENFANVGSQMLETLFMAQSLGYGIIWCDTCWHKGVVTDVFCIGKNWHFVTEADQNVELNICSRILRDDGQLERAYAWRTENVGSMRNAPVAFEQLPSFGTFGHSDGASDVPSGAIERFLRRVGRSV